MLVKFVLDQYRYSATDPSSKCYECKNTPAPARPQKMIGHSANE